MIRLPLLIASLLVVLGALPVHAQQLSYTIKAGLAVFDIRGDTDADFEPRTALSGGFGLGYDFGNGFAVMPELFYTVKGGYTNTTLETSVTSPDGTTSTSVTPVRARFDLAYIDLPVLLTYQLGRGSVQPRVFAGPWVGYNVSARVNVRARGSGSGFSQSYSDDSVQTWEYGLVGGLGADVLVGGERVRVEGRAHWGQANVRSSEPALHNRGVALLVGLAF